MERGTVKLLIYAAAIATVVPILGYRKRAMRRLAAKLKFQYLGRKLPDSFPSSADLWSNNPFAWNVISGFRHGYQILAFDSIIGEGRGRYCTFIAVRTLENPFEMKNAQWKLLQSNGWTALYWIGPWNNFATWTMGIRFIEQVVIFLNTRLSQAPFSTAKKWTVVDNDSHNDSVDDVHHRPAEG